LRILIERIIGKLKGDPLYRMDEDYSARQLISILYIRFCQVLRGYVLKLRVSSSGVIFCGRRVVVRFGYQITAGKSLILEDGVHLEALSSSGIILGNHVTIAKHAILSCTGVIANKGVGIQIGNNSAVGAQSFLGGQGGIVIGNDVIMGPQVKMFSENHNYASQVERIRLQGVSRKGITIGDNCWIGAGTTILDGVAISQGCVIAAGSVVTKSIPENSIARGIPAVVVGTRSLNAKQ